MPQLWVVAGPNGAGKTTIADLRLARKLPVISPDSIASSQKISPVQAGRAAILEQDRLLADRLDFALDTTLSGNRELSLMKRASQAGYKVSVVFVCVEFVTLCHARISQRIESGGHSVPAEDVARRYKRSLANLPAAFDLADRVFVLDNTGVKWRLLLSVNHGRVKNLSRNLPQWAIDSIPKRFTSPKSKGGRRPWLNA